MQFNAVRMRMLMKFGRIAISVGAVLIKKKLNESDFILTIERIIATYPKMTSTERAALADWEVANIPLGGKSTSDWPGWESVFSRLSH